MRFERLWAAVATTTLAATLHAQVQTGSTANVNADGGYVAIQTGRTSWQGMTDVAAGATINLDPSAFEGEGGGGGEGGSDKTQFKFSNSNGTLEPTTYSDSATGAGGSSATTGASRITSSPTAPTYYSAGWGGTATSPTSSSTGQLSGVGTYDPWSITYNSLYSQGANPGDTVNLYYQSGLFVTGIYGPTGAFPSGPNGSAYYEFQTYAQSAGGSFPFFLTLIYNAGGSPIFNYANNGEFDVYLLGANAQDPSASPSDRTGAADAQRLDANNFQSILVPLIGPNGTPTRDLNFGIVRHFLVPSVPTNGSPNDTLFEWHTNTVAATSVAPVPEPSALAALGLGAAALLRRRKRA